MKSRIFILIVLALVICSSVSNYAQSPSINDINEKSHSYEWFWDLLANAPSSIAGDDPLTWGGDLGPYFNYTEVMNRLFLLNETFPELIDLFSIGNTSYYGKELWMIRITNEAIYENKNSYMIHAGTHAREAITVMNALYSIDKFIYDYLEGDNTVKNSVQNGIRSKTFYFEDSFSVPDIKTILDHTEIYILPSLNPDGLDIMHINPNQRKNLKEIDDNGDGDPTNDFTNIRDVNNDGYLDDFGDHLEGGQTEYPGGVDLNRNYGYHWASSTDKKSASYPGESPFSELETQAMRDWVYEHENDLNGAISLHSGVAAIAGPWGYTSRVDTELEEINSFIDDGMKPLTGFPNWDDFGGYAANGLFEDWLYGELGIPGFTIETYGGYGGIWDYFNPAPNKILTISENVHKALYFMACNPRTTANRNILPELIVENSSFNDNILTANWSALDIDLLDLNETLDFNSSVLISPTGYDQWKVLNSSKNGIIANLTGLDAKFVKICVMDELGGKTFSQYPLDALNTLHTEDQDPPEVILKSPEYLEVKPNTQISLGISGSIDFYTYNWNEYQNSTVKLSYKPVVPASQGIHLLNLYVTDAIGNWIHKQFNFTVDNTAPSITLLNPTNSSIIKPGTQIIFNYTDIFGDIKYHWDTNSFTVLNNGTFPRAPNKNGWHSLTMRAFDKAGNMVLTTYRFYIDNIVPKVIIDKPINNSIVQAGDTFSVNSTEMNCIIIYNWNGGTNVTSTNLTQITVLSSPGDNTINIYVIDDAGNIVTAKIFLTVEISTTTTTAKTVNTQNINFLLVFLIISIFGVIRKSKH